MKKTLKLAKKHPNKKMRLGRHMITNIAHTYTLDKKEAARLESKGGKVWFKEVDESQAKPMPKEPKELTNKQRLVKDLKEMGVKVPSKATEEQLEEIMVQELAK